MGLMDGWYFYKVIHKELLADNIYLGMACSVSLKNT